MKCLALFLFVGVFLPCFYLECKAFEYRDLRHHGRSYVLEAENTVDKVRHHRSRRESPPLVLANETDCENVKCQNKTVKTNHKYYVSQVVNNGQGYWIDVDGNPKIKSVEHPLLSDSYLLRQNFKLSFQFPYYGHLLDQVMLTTGGFLYMDTHDTKLMTQVQYLAPLMAYFNPHLKRDSKVLTLDDGSKLTVEWRNVLLHENTTVEPFTFQCTLHKNGTIWFAYKKIPIKVTKIPTLPYHPVKVGIADAFVIRYRNTRTDTLYRFFYIYSAINITKQSVAKNVAVIFEPQLSCVGADSCTVCMERTEDTNFTCQWCPKTQKCSDGVDRHREEWERNKCNDNAIKEMSEWCLRGGIPTARPSKDKKGCVGADSCTACMKRTAETNFTCQWCPKIQKCSDGVDRHREEWERNECNDNAIKKMSEECLSGGPPSKQGKSKDQKRNSKDKKGIGAGAIIGIIVILVLVIGIAAWCVYAYKHPTSKSGLFFIEATRKPRDFFKRSPGVSGNTGPADPSDIKPQVL
ncbi:plexin domain-containing protein 2-like isoform X1 [Oculina patagonica]